MAGFNKVAQSRFFQIPKGTPGDPEGDAVGWEGRQEGPAENFPGF